MRRSTVTSVPPQLAFPAYTYRHVNILLHVGVWFSGTNYLVIFHLQIVCQWFNHVNFTFFSENNLAINLAGFHQVNFAYSDKTVWQLLCQEFHSVKFTFSWQNYLAIICWGFCQVNFTLFWQNCLAIVLSAIWPSKFYFFL